MNRSQSHPAPIPFVPLPEQTPDRGFFYRRLIRVEYNERMGKQKKATSPTGLYIELIPDPEQGGFTAHVPNIPAYGEGETEKEAMNDLKEALIGYIEAFGLEETLSRVSKAPKFCFVQWKLDKLVDA